MTTPRPTKEQLAEAMAVLERYGRHSRTNPDQCTTGEAIGNAIYATNDVGICVDAAVEMLEQWNGHLSVAALLAIEKGQGTVQRNGRTLTITLPPHWAKIG